MKTTLIATVLNEEDNIAKYLDSVLNQTKKPDEIIIVDAGSTDKTIKILKEYKKVLPIKIIIEKGCTISQAENIAIKQSKHDIILGGCAGITIKKDMFEQLLKKLDDNVDIVTGVYMVLGKTKMQKAIADVFQYSLIPNIKNVDDNFNSTNRSLAYKKKIWKILGKYPEHLNRADDTWFNAEARRKGLKFKLAKNAIAYWYARKNLKLVFKYCYLDVKCDIENGFEKKRYVKYWLDLFAIIISAVGMFLGLSPVFFYGMIGINLIYFVYYSIKTAITNGKISRIPLYISVIITLMLSTCYGLIMGKIKNENN